MGQKHTTMTDSATNAFPFPAVSSRDVLDLTIPAKNGVPISDIPNRLIVQSYRIFMLDEEQVNLETAFMRLTRGLIR